MKKKGHDQKETEKTTLHGLWGHSRPWIMLNIAASHALRRLHLCPPLSCDRTSLRQMPPHLLR
jgi:hypothetical protein